MPYQFNKITSKYSSLDSVDDSNFPFGMEELKRLSKTNDKARYLFELLNEVKFWRDQNIETSRTVTDLSVQKFFLNLSEYLFSRFPRDENIVAICNRFMNSDEVDLDLDDILDQNIAIENSDQNLDEIAILSNQDRIDNLENSSEGDQEDDQESNHKEDEQESYSEENRSESEEDEQESYSEENRSESEEDEQDHSQEEDEQDQIGLPNSLYSSIIDHKDSVSFYQVMTTLSAYVFEIVKILEKNDDDISRFEIVKNCLLYFPGIDREVDIACVPGSQQRIADVLIKIKKIPLIFRIIEEEITKGFIEFGSEIDTQSEIHFKSCLFSLVNIADSKDQFRYIPDKDIELSKAFIFMKSFKENFFKNLDEKIYDYYDELQRIVELSSSFPAEDRFAWVNTALTEFCQRINFDFEIEKEESKLSLHQLFDNEAIDESGFIWSNLISKEQWIILLKSYFDNLYKFTDQSDDKKDYLDYLSEIEFHKLFTENQKLDPLGIDDLKEFLLYRPKDIFQQQQKKMADLVLLNILARNFHGKCPIYFENLLKTLARDSRIFISASNRDYRVFFESFFSSLKDSDYFIKDQEDLAIIINYLCDAKEINDKELKDVKDVYKDIYLQKSNIEYDKFYYAKNIMSQTIEVYDPVLERKVRMNYLNYALISGHDQAIDFILTNNPDANIVEVSEEKSSNLMLAIAYNQMSSFKKILATYHETIDKILSDQTSAHDKAFYFDQININFKDIGQRIIIHCLSKFSWGYKYFDDLMAINQRLEDLRIYQGYNFSEKKFNLDDVDINSRSSVHYASLLGNSKVLEKLLSSNARIDLKDENNFLALHHATYRDNYKEVELLLKRNNQLQDNGFNIDDHSQSSYNSLKYAISNDNMKIVELLIKYGANFNIDSSEIDPSEHEFESKKIQSVIARLDLESLIFLAVVHDTKNQESVYNLKVNQSLKSLTDDDNKSYIDEKITILDLLFKNLQSSALDQRKKLAVIKFFSEKENYLKLKDIVQGKEMEGVEDIKNLPLPQCLKIEEQKLLVKMVDSITCRSSTSTQVLTISRLTPVKRRSAEQQ